MPKSWKSNNCLLIISASVLEPSDTEMSKYLNGCQAITSCLGHNITWKGMYLKPRRLVTDAARRITILIRANKPEEPIKYILMNITGNSNRDLNEPISIAITSTGGQ